ncbi:hypothetical protein L1887_37189 [Cichorium endivia]|nr:hypothetical protein L1887_37189 [Cichorium endivia]
MGGWLVAFSGVSSCAFVFGNLLTRFLPSAASVFQVSAAVVMVSALYMIILLLLEGSIDLMVQPKMIQREQRTDDTGAWDGDETNPTSRTEVRLTGTRAGVIGAFSTGFERGESRLDTGTVSRTVDRGFLRRTPSRCPSVGDKFPWLSRVHGGTGGDPNAGEDTAATGRRRAANMRPVKNNFANRKILLQIIIL